MATVNEVTDKASQVTLDPVSTTGDAKLSKPVDAEPIPSFNSVISAHLEHIYNSLATSSKGSFSSNVQKEPHADSGDTDHLASLAAFRAYMASPASSALQAPQKLDLSAPITDYFISSSHNTYLTGNQLYSNAAADAYTNVSLSCWLVAFASTRVIDDCRRLLVAFDSSPIVFHAYN